MHFSWGTHWEFKIIKNAPHPPQKEKPWASWVHVASLHWLSRIFISTFIYPRFQLG
jgi:hypothetical protein